MDVSTHHPTVKNGAQRIKNKMWDNRSEHSTESHDASCWHLQTLLTATSPETEEEEDRGKPCSCC
jgi:hypothetical protein